MILLSLINGTNIKKKSYLNIFLINWIHNRTTTNIELDEDESIISISFDSDDDNSKDKQNDKPNDEPNDEPNSKKRRSNNGDQLKVFQTIADDMKQNQVKKMEMLQQVMQPKSGLELFFASICKTVEKFSPLDQAKIKSAISGVVSDMEIANLENLYSYEDVQVHNN